MENLSAQVILCTCPNQEIADTIANTLVDEHLAACVNTLPGVQSVYRWKDQVEKAQEYLLIIKASAGNFAGISSRIRAMHPYELPEIIAVPVADGLKEYLAWINNP